MKIWKLLYKKAFRAGYSQGFREGEFVARQKFEDELKREIEQKYDEMDEYYDAQIKEEMLKDKDNNDQWLAEGPDMTEEGDK